MPIQSYTKRLNESAPYAYDFKNDAVVAAGDTILSVTSVIATPVAPEPTSGVTNVTVGATSTISGTQVIVAISGGQDDAQYLIEFTILTTGGYSRVGEGYLCVNDR